MHPWIPETMDTGSEVVILSILNSPVRFHSHVSPIEYKNAVYGTAAFIFKIRYTRAEI